MSWLDGFTRNWADLTTEASDPDLRPVVLPFSPEEAVEWASSVIRKMSRWSVVESAPREGRLHATHRTLVWRFVDDVHLRFEPDPRGGVRITGRSRSRVGKGDLGQNARNLRELTRSLRAAAAKPAPPPRA
jgi:uncharacterized protein (DUF1499 family)